MFSQNRLAIIVAIVVVAVKKKYNKCKKKKNRKWSRIKNLFLHIIILKNLIKQCINPQKIKTIK